MYLKYRRREITEEIDNFDYLFIKGLDFYGFLNPSMD